MKVHRSSSNALHYVDPHVGIIGFTGNVFVTLAEFCVHLISLQEGVDELGWRHILDDVDLEMLFPSGLDRTSLEEFFSAVRISDISDTSAVAQRARKFFIRYCTELDSGLIGKKT